MNAKYQDLKVNEIFYSIQGEGSRAGQPSIFIRLTGCNMSCDYCDTDFKKGEWFSLETILMAISIYRGEWIVWTGGEPTLQLRDDTIAFFKRHGYYQAIETNGTKTPPDGLDYITVSPKVPIDTLHENFKVKKINEIRYIWTDDGIYPPLIEFLPDADYYYISPMFEQLEITTVSDIEKNWIHRLPNRNLKSAIEFIKVNPKWRLSVQQHKLWGIV